MQASEEDGELIHYLKLTLMCGDLQQTEAGGKIASLDETLGANIHLSRIEREKQAAQAAAAAATEARKVALVEASWCHILKATG